LKNKLNDTGTAIALIQASYMFVTKKLVIHNDSVSFSNDLPPEDESSRLYWVLSYGVSEDGDKMINDVFTTTKIMLKEWLLKT